MTVNQIVSFDFIRQLVQFQGVDAGQKPAGFGFDDKRRCRQAWLWAGDQAAAQQFVHNSLESAMRGARNPPQLCGDVIIDSQCSPHDWHHDVYDK